MGFEHSGDRLRMFCVLFRDDSQVADLVPVVALEVFQRFFKVGGHFSRRAAGDRTSRGPGRHGDFTQKKRGTQRCRSMLLRIRFPLDLARQQVTPVNRTGTCTCNSSSGAARNTELNASGAKVFGPSMRTNCARSVVRLLAKPQHASKRTIHSARIRSSF